MEQIIVSEADRIGRITLNRTEKRNALTNAMLARILEAMDAFKRDDRIRVLLLCARGSAFCSGLDLAEMQRGGFDAELLSRVFQRFAKHPDPTVARVQGAAVAGGCELALHCDVRIGSPTARFIMPLVRLGLVAPCEVVERLVNTIGLTAARDMLITGDPIDGERAERVGLLTRLVRAEELEDRTEEMVHRLATNAPLSARTMKRMLDRLAYTIPPEEQAELDAERIRISRSDDMREGLQAFFERRAPAFRGA